MVTVHVQLTNLQTHTMAPVHLLSYGFLRILNSKEVVQSKKPSRVQNEDNTVDMDDDSEAEERSELNRIIPERLASTTNRLTEEDAERRNAEFNRLSNEKPKHSLTFMLSTEEWE